MPHALPTGIVTYLFTDIEGSTRLLDRVGSVRYGELLAAHHSVIRRAIADHNGVELGTEGDSFFAVFRASADGVAAAINAQRGLHEEPLLTAERVHVRMGLHTGAAEIGGDNYTGMAVHLGSRVSGAAHGGQILVTNEVADGTVAGTEFLDLGEYWLKDIGDPVRIFQVTAAGIESEFPPVDAAATHPQNAPRDLSSFVGRESEIASALELLTQGNRMVTLTGPGGTGKTRLAIEIGAAASRNYRQGVFFAPLAGIDDVESVPNSIIDAVNAPASNTSLQPIALLLEHLKDRHTLLIIDNCEHVLAAAGYLKQILDGAPNVAILATSRTPLNVRGERELSIAPLDVGSAATQLFTDRATSVKASFELDDTNRADVDELVRRLDGLPLAIELAAARVRMMSPAAILETLDPLSLGGARTRDGELTLNDTIQWSYDLLGPEEQRLMVRLGVFPTGARLAQIDDVCKPTELGLDLINGVGSLVEHSLLVGDELHAFPRFRMLETIREFSVRKLSGSPDEDAVRHRHMVAYTELLEEAVPKLNSPDSAEWMARLAIENANLQSAFAHAIATNNAEYAQRIVASAWRFWQSRGHLAEGTEAAAAALRLDGSTDDVRARAIDAAGSIAYWVGDQTQTRSYYEQAVDFRRENGVTDGLANALLNLSYPVSDQDGLEPCLVLLNEALDIAAAENDDAMQAMLHSSLARAWLDSSAEESLRHARDALDWSQSMHDPISRAWAFSLEAAALQRLGRHTEAATALQASLAVFRDTGDLSGIALDLAGLADVAEKVSDESTALYLVGVVHQLRSETGIGLRTAIDSTIQKYLAPGSVEALSEDLQSRYEAGKADTLERAIDTALDWTAG